MKAGSGPVPPSPAATFPVYGLEPSWPGARWLDGVGDMIGDPVRWVRLAHQDRETGTLIMAMTHSRPLTDAGASRRGEPPLQAVALDAAVVLVNFTLPSSSQPWPEGLLRALVRHADHASRQHAQWPPVPWRIDGVAVTARAWRFAGGWAAVCDAGDVYVGAAGSGDDPAPLALTRLADGRDYHWELGTPLHPRMMPASAAAAGIQATFEPSGWHADHLQLMQDKTG